jgi:magnesium-transporting ATPase (P-type)
MTTLLNEDIETGDVIELSRGDDVITALVLLAADEAVILDACDGSTPFVVKRDELIEYRKFNPTT